jgi:hypothetical protein
MASLEREGWRAALFDLTNQMEEPLREASQFMRVIGLIDGRNGEDEDAIAAVAWEAVIRLEKVAEAWRGLNDLHKGAHEEG